MTDQELRALGPALADYLDRYLFCCGWTQTFAHLGAYVRGLLSDLERKTCEPIAKKAGTPVRTLQEFLSSTSHLFVHGIPAPSQMSPPDILVARLAHPVILGAP